MDAPVMERVRQRVGALLSSATNCLQLSPSKPLVTQSTDSYSWGCTDVEQGIWRSTSSPSCPKAVSACPKQVKTYSPNHFFVPHTAQSGDWLAPRSLGSVHLPIRELLGLPQPESHPLSSRPDHCRDIKNKERGQDYFLYFLPGVPLPRLDENLQPRPYQCLQHTIPTTAAHAARGPRGNTTWGFAGWCLSPRGTSNRGIWGYFFYLHIYLGPRPEGRQAPW